MQNQNKLHFRQTSRSIALFIVLCGLVASIGCSGISSNQSSANSATPKPLPSGNSSTPKPLSTEKPGNAAETNKPESNKPETSQTEENPAELPLPENGYGKFFFKKSKTASRLKFVPQAGTKGNMIVKMEDWETKKPVCWFFVREGKTVETPIPEGSYRFKIATGDKWYGEQYLFGREATYSSISSNVKIPTRTIYTLNLTPSEVGTLQDEEIEPGDF